MKHNSLHIVEYTCTLRSRVACPFLSTPFMHTRLFKHLMSMFNVTKTYNTVCDKKKRDMQSISVSSKLFFNSRLIDQGIGFISDMHIHVHVHVLCVQCTTVVHT